MTSSFASIKTAFELHGKVALVTGASKGIGRAIAHGLAEFGAEVVVSSRKQAAVDAVAMEIQNAGYAAYAVAANMGKQNDIDKLIQATQDHYGGIDIIVNNAAANPVYGSIDNTDSRAYDKIMDVNLRGPFELNKAAYPILKQRGGGSIINLSSIGGFKPEPGIGMYSVSKAAIINLSQAMAQDWGQDNIRVNAICPGLIKTDFSEALWNNEENLQHFLSKIPLRRIGKAEDVAGLAVFLASDAAAYCSGAAYLVDGGYLTQ